MSLKSIARKNARSGIMQQIKNDVVPLKVKAFISVVEVTAKPLLKATQTVTVWVDRKGKPKLVPKDTVEYDAIILRTKNTPEIMRHLEKDGIIALASNHKMYAVLVSNGGGDELESMRLSRIGRGFTRPLMFV